MAENKIFLGKPRSGLCVTTQLSEIKVSMEQMKQSYREITVEDVKELKVKAIGSIVK